RVDAFRADLLRGARPWIDPDRAAIQSALTAHLRHQSEDLGRRPPCRRPTFRWSGGICAIGGFSPLTEHLHGCRYDASALEIQRRWGVKELSANDPTVIGSYRVIGVLGSGGMGRVYLGQSRQSKRLAIKVLRAELAEDPVYRRRFAREVV